MLWQNKTKNGRHSHKKVQGCLGPSLRILHPRGIQSMIFKEDDNGTFCMSKEQKENTRHNRIIQEKSKTRTLRKEELKKLLEAKGLSTKRTAKEMIKRAEEDGINSKETMDKVVEGG
jgi:hypothetical protein